MAELANCSSCGNVFAKGMRDICPTCYKLEEEAFQKVYKFLSLRKNREATLDEIAEQTNVERELIMKFLKQNRLQSSKFPKLSYPCEMCGEGIVEGKLCAKCSVSIHKDLMKLEESERKQAELDRDRETVYYTMNKNNKR